MDKTICDDDLVTSNQQRRLVRSEKDLKTHFNMNPPSTPPLIASAHMPCSIPTDLSHEIEIRDELRAVEGHIATGSGGLL